MSPPAAPPILQNLIHTEPLHHNHSHSHQNCDARASAVNMPPKRKRDPGVPLGPATKTTRDSLLTVKTGLSKFCTSQALKASITRAVHQVSLMSLELSKLLNLHFLICCEQPNQYVCAFTQNDFYTLVQGVSKGSRKGLRDLSSADFENNIQGVAEAQHVYFSLRPPDLEWGCRDGVGQCLKAATDVVWDNCSQDQLVNFERRLSQWWHAEVRESLFHVSIT